MKLLIVWFLAGILEVPFSRGDQPRWRAGYNYNKPLPQEIMVDAVNYIGLVLLQAHNQNNDNNIALSPYGATSVLVALGEGVQGTALDEILRASLLPLDVSVTRVGLRDIHRHLKSYFIPQEGFLAGLTFSHENVTLKTSYEDILKFYGYDVDSFNNALYPDPYTSTTPGATSLSSSSNSASFSSSVSTTPITFMNPTTIENRDNITDSESTTEPSTIVMSTATETDTTPPGTTVTPTISSSITDQTSGTIPLTTTKGMTVQTTNKVQTTTISPPSFTSTPMTFTTKPISTVIQRSTTNQISLTTTTNQPTTITSADTETQPVITTTTTTNRPTTTTQPTIVTQSPTTITQPTTTTTKRQISSTSETSTVQDTTTSQPTTDTTDQPTTTTQSIITTNRPTTTHQTTTVTQPVTTTIQPTTITTNRPTTSSQTTTTTQAATTTTNQPTTITQATTTTQFATTTTEQPTTITQTTTTTQSATTTTEPPTTTTQATTTTQSAAATTIQPTTTTQATTITQAATITTKQPTTITQATTTIQSATTTTDQPNTTTQAIVTPQSATTTTMQPTTTSQTTTTTQSAATTTAPPTIATQATTVTQPTTIATQPSTTTTQFTTTTEPPVTTAKSPTTTQAPDITESLTTTTIKPITTSTVQTTASSNQITTSLSSATVSTTQSSTATTSQTTSGSISTTGATTYTSGTTRPSLVTIDITPTTFGTGKSMLDDTAATTAIVPIVHPDGSIGINVQPTTIFSTNTATTQTGLPAATLSVTDTTTSSDGLATGNTETTTFTTLPQSTGSYFTIIASNSNDQDSAITISITPSTVGTNTESTTEEAVSVNILTGDNLSTGFELDVRNADIVSAQNATPRDAKATTKGTPKKKSRPRFKDDAELVNLLKSENKSAAVQRVGGRDFVRQITSTLNSLNLDQKIYTNSRRPETLTSTEEAEEISLVNDVPTLDYNFSTDDYYDTTKSSTKSDEDFSIISETDSSIRDIKIREDEYFALVGKEGSRRSAYSSISEESSVSEESTVEESSFPPANKTERNKNRATRSVIDYLIARYHDNNAPPYMGAGYEPLKPTTFAVNGKIREPNISFMTYDTVLPFRYISYLNALALTFPLDSTKYYLLLLLPVDDMGIDNLINNLMSTTLKQIIYDLQPTRVKATIPSFMLKGYVVLTPTLQKLGISQIFEPRHADFSRMTDDKDIYVTNIEQAITVTIRNYIDPATLQNNQHFLRRGPVQFTADHPFLYFVMDSSIHVALMAGKIINPLNSRIR